MTSLLRSSTCGLIVLSAVLLLACGGSADDEARRVQTTSVIAENDPVKRYLVRQSEIEREAAGSVRRAFLQYWSDLQFQAWETAARAYEPGLRRYLGQDGLMRALAIQGASYRGSRPNVVATTTRGERAIIKFFRIGTEATVPISFSWSRDASGRWLIAYDPLLDQALGDVRQVEMQQSIDPLAQKPAPPALRAGSRARKLQSQYVAERDGATARER